MALSSSHLQAYLFSIPPRNRHNFQFCGLFIFRSILFVIFGISAVADTLRTCCIFHRILRCDAKLCHSKVCNVRYLEGMWQLPATHGCNYCHTSLINESGLVVEWVSCWFISCTLCRTLNNKLDVYSFTLFLQNITGFIQMSRQANL